MGENILNSELIPTKDVDKKVKAPKTTTKKDSNKPSLFDKILQNSKEDIKKDDKSVKTKNNTTKTELKTTETIKQTKTTSLFDNLKLKAKQSNKTKTISKDTTKNIVSNKTDENKKNVKSSKTKSDNTKTDIKNKEIVSKSKDDIQQNKKQTKTTSLFDNLKSKAQKSNTSKVVIKDDIKQDKLQKTEQKDKTTSKIEVQKNSKQSKENKEVFKKDIVTNVKQPKENKLTIQTEDKKSKEKSSTISKSVSPKEEKKEIKIEEQPVLDKNSKIDNIEIKSEEKQVNIQDDEQKKQTPTVKNSLMDSLVLKAKEDSNDSLEQKNVKQDNSNKNNQKNLKAEIFLKEQTTHKKIISTQKKEEATQILNKPQQGVESIKKSAKVLDLNMQNSEIIDEVKEEGAKPVVTNHTLKEQYNNQNNMLNKIFLNQFNLDDKIIKQQEEKTTVNNSSISADEVNTKDIDLVVDKSVVQTITTKIVESKQKLNSFLSEVARKMYANYKPPVTAFRFNLNPSHLGNIAITMKSDRATNSLSVSLKMTHHNTLEVFSDNKAVLQNALVKSFDNQTNLSLSFDMQNNDSNNAFEQFNQQQNKNQQQSISADDLQQNDNIVEDAASEDQNYM